MVRNIAAYYRISFDHKVVAPLGFYASVICSEPVTGLTRTIRRSHEVPTMEEALQAGWELLVDHLNNEQRYAWQRKLNLPR